MIGSVNLALCKAVTEQFETDGLDKDLNVYIYIIIAIAMGIFLLKTINISMEIYD